MHPYNSISNRRATADLLDWIEKVAEGGENVTDDARKIAQAEQSTPNAAACRTEIDRLRAKRSRLADGFTDGIITRADYQQQLADIEHALRTTEAELATLQARRTVSRVEAVRAFGRLRDEWPRWTPHGQREALAAVVTCVIVQPGPYGPNKIRPIPAWGSA